MAEPAHDAEHHLKRAREHLSSHVRRRREIQELAAQYIQDQQAAPETAPAQTPPQEEQPFPPPPTTSTMDSSSLSPGSALSPETPTETATPDMSEPL
jgi:hypothetical protein